jgi:mono/diheme cytochrome c family protein
VSSPRDPQGIERVGAAGPARKLRGVWLAILLAGLIALGGLWTASASAQNVTGAAGPQATPPTLDTQLANGENVYRLVCSACHAYNGEGLTAAWLRTWAPPDQNCWQSKCHAANHPPDGFVLPHYVPAIAGRGTLEAMRTAQDLFAFIHTAMPFQDPGYLSQQDYWDITAHILVLNHVPVGPDPVGQANAASIALHPSSLAAGPPAPAGSGQATSLHRVPASRRISWPFGSATLGLIVAALVIGLITRTRPSEGRDRQ